MTGGTRAVPAALAVLAGPSAAADLSRLAVKGRAATMHLDGQARFTTLALSFPVTEGERA